MSEIRRRVDLPPKERAVSDALDEWLIREHGILESWANPDDFIVFLEKREYIILSNKERDELQRKLDLAREAIELLESLSCIESEEDGELLDRAHELIEMLGEPG